MPGVSIAMWPARTGHAYILCLVHCQCLELNGTSEPVGATTEELLQLHAHYYRPPPTLSVSSVEDAVAQRRTLTRVAVYALPFRSKGIETGASLIWGHRRERRAQTKPGAAIGAEA